MWTSKKIQYVSIRNNADKNKFKKINSYSTVVMAISTVVLAIMNYSYLKLTNETLEETRKQTKLNVNPSVRILPELTVDSKGDSTKFFLTILNDGMSDISEVKMFKDFFLGYKDRDSGLGAIHVGSTSAYPDTTYSLIRANDSSIYNMNLSNIYQVILNAYKEADIKRQVEKNTECIQR